MPTYRVYFNRHAEFPTVFSVDEGDQSSEINVARVEGHRVNFEFHYDPNVKINPDTPSAWMTVHHAVLQVREGTAHLFHDPDWRSPRIQGETPEQREARMERETSQRITGTP